MTTAEFSRVSGLDFTSSTFAIKAHHSREYTTIKHSITSSVFESHIKGDEVVALPKHPHTKSVFFDIDQRSQIKGNLVVDIVKQLTDDLGPFTYAEYSKETGGAHVQFIFKDYISEEALRWLELHYKTEHQYIIEPLYGCKKLRVQFSKDYRLAGSYAPNCRRFIKPVNSIEEVYDILANPTPTKFPNILRDHNKWGIPLSAERDKAENVQDDTFDGQRNFSYGRGNRHIIQLNIGFYAVANNMTFDEFKVECENWDDGTSRDMKKSDDFINKMLRDIFTYCTKKFNDDFFAKKTDDSGVPNALIYDEDGLDLEDDLYDKINFVFNNSYRGNRLGKILNGKTQHKFVKGAYTLYALLLQFQKYRRDNNFTYESHEFLNGAVLFDETMKRRACKELNIVNIDKSLQFLKDLGLISQVSDDNGYTHSYKGQRWANHFTVNGVLEVFEEFLRFLLSTIYTINSKYSINNTNKGDSTTNQSISNSTKFFSSYLEVDKKFNPNKLDHRLRWLRLEQSLIIDHET